MPYITKSELADISPLSGTAKAIELLSDLKFAKIEAVVADIVFKKTNIAIPDDADDTPQGLKLPCAWILEYIYSSMSDNLSAEKLALIKSNYDKALEMLDTFNKEVHESRFSVIELEGLYEL